jgi:hypothetical protein
VGLRLRRPDKKSEKAALAALRSRLLGALSSEQDPAAALALVVPLLFIKATGEPQGVVWHIRVLVWGEINFSFESQAQMVLP